MPPVACPECGQENLVFFRSLRTHHCQGCGAVLPHTLPSAGPGLAARVLEQSHHDLRRIPLKGEDRTPASPR
jgi:ribosomal protein S27E